MKPKLAYELTAPQIHEALIAAGFTPLVALRQTIHWVRDGRHVITGYTEQADRKAIEDLKPNFARYVHFAQLSSGEIIAL